MMQNVMEVVIVTANDMSALRGATVNRWFWFSAASQTGWPKCTSGQNRNGSCASIATPRSTLADCRKPSQ